MRPAAVQAFPGPSENRSEGRRFSQPSLDHAALTPVRWHTARSTGALSRPGFVQGRLRPRHIQSARGALAAPPALPPRPGVWRRPHGVLRASRSSAREEEEGPVVLIEVSVDEEAIVGYRQTAEACDDGLEPVLRAPLLLATAAQSVENKGLVCVTLATPTANDCLGGMQVAPGEARSPFCGRRLLPEGAGCFSFACGSERSAQMLLVKLSAAGCVLHGFLQRYKIRKEVGRGGFGVVYLARDTWNDQEVAVKVFLCSGHRKCVHPFREAILLRWAKDPLFPEFKAAYKVSDEELEEMGLGEKLFTDTIALVTEYIPGGDLFSSLAQHGPLSEDAARAVMQQVLSGLVALDRLGVIHRDIKTENVMFGSGNRVKLVDFGLACPWWDEEAAIERVGSVGYIAPEVLRQLPQSSKADCFSTGALLYTCLAGHGPFHSESMHATLMNNARNRVDFRSLAAFSAGAQDLVQLLLQTDPDQRPTAQQCLQHPWLAAPGLGAFAGTQSMPASVSDTTSGTGASSWSSRSSLSSPDPRECPPRGMSFLSQHSLSTAPTVLAWSGTGPRAGSVRSRGPLACTHRHSAPPAAALVPAGLGARPFLAEAAGFRLARLAPE